VFQDGKEETMDDSYPVTFSVDYPDRDLDRLTSALRVAVTGAWYAILFSNRYPRGIFDYAEGVICWHNRVVGYALILVTDQCPPFRLRP